jgi:hypothetical protein
MGRRFNMKISKASWMILAAGVFIIILAGLGMTRSGQINEYDTLVTDFNLASTRLNNQQTGNIQTEINEYSQQLIDVKDQAEEAKRKLDQTVVSVDVAEKFYEIADYCGITVGSLNTSTIAYQSYSGIPCYTVSVAATLTGEKQKLIDFVIALNNTFTTGYVTAAGFAINEDDLSNINIQMTVYSRTGSGS